MLILTAIFHCFLISVISSSPPKLFLLSHTVVNDQVDIAVNSSVHLRCSGDQPLVWSFPNNNPYEPVWEDAVVKAKCDDQRAPRCLTDVLISELSAEMTGLFTCHYNDSLPTGAANSDSIYIFVNDPEQLLVPYEGSSEFIFIAVFQSQPATIPCKPTSSQAKVSLWKVHTGTGHPEQIHTDPILGITYNSRVGFHFEYPRWDAETSLLECKAELGEQQNCLSVNIHWSILPIELHPIIDDSQAKSVFVNSTFTLKCLVHIELGVIIVIDWDGPGLADPSRVIESPAETQRLELNGNSFDTVSKNLTITRAQVGDQGVYHCNVTDGNGRVFSVSKRVVIYEDGLPPPYVNFTMDIDNKKSIIRKVDDSVRFVVDVHAFPDFSSVMLTWYHNGHEITNLDRHYKIGTSKDGEVPQAFLTVEKLTVEDSGDFMLMGNTTEMMNKIMMKLLVHGPSVVKMDNPNNYYQLGKSYTIPCHAIGYPKANVWWKFIPCDSFDNCVPSANESVWIDVINIADSPATGDYNNDKLVWINETNSYNSRLDLQIKASRSGIYRCFSQNMNESISYKQILFIVTDAIGGFSLTSSSDDPVELDDITLSCLASVFNYTSLHFLWQSFDSHIAESLENRTDLVLTSSVDRYSHKLKLRINPIKHHHSGMYICEAIDKEEPELINTRQLSLEVQNITAPRMVNSNMMGKIIEKAMSTAMEFTCEAAGKPKPKITWFRNRKLFVVDGKSGIKLENNGQKIIFTRLLDKDSGFYECVVENRGGRIIRSVSLKVLGADGFKPEDIFIIFLLVTIGAAMMMMAVYIGKKIRQERKQKHELEMLSQNLFDQGQLELFNPDMSLDEQIELLPYDKRYEFPKERLKLGRTLGQGAFGRVVRAEAIGLSDDETSTTVAVKMLKERADFNQRKALMAELKILIHLGRHLNIVNLLGAVTKNLHRGELLVMVEYCRFGNLRHYLLANRDLFVNQLDENHRIDPNIKTLQNSGGFKNGGIVSDGRFYENIFNAPGINNPNYTSTTFKERHPSVSHSVSNSIKYADLLHQQQSSNYTNGFVVLENEGSGSGSGSGNSDSVMSYRGESIRHKNKDKLITTCDLLCYSFQCARGMQYLASRKLIHRDLAARNVLLADENVVKICDFGLAKDVYKYDNYVKKGDGPLPVKWMAIESIRDKVFTSKSDVWSFGILLWEFFTLGGNPYPGVEIDEEFYKRLKAGYRMEKPEFAPNEIYNMMSHCWQAEAKDRPDFGQVAEALGSMLETHVRQHYLDLNNPYQEMNQQILNNNDYIQMNSDGYLQPNGQYLDMKSPEDNDSRPPSDPLKHYDNLDTEHVRPVNSEVPTGKEPMEVVPMIQLDSYGSRYDVEYLNMDSANNTVTYLPTSNTSSPPPYNLVMQKI